MEPFPIDVDPDLSRHMASLGHNELRNDRKSWKYEYFLSSLKQSPHDKELSLSDPMWTSHYPYDLVSVVWDINSLRSSDPHGDRRWIIGQYWFR